MANFNLEDGSYEVELTMEGGSGKATVEKDTTMTVENGEPTVEVTWSSPNYDYMIVADETYYPVNTEGNSVFEIPVLAVNEPYTVVGDTVAMSKPHEIEYQFTVTCEAAATQKTQLPMTAILLIAFAVVFAATALAKRKRH